MTRRSVDELDAMARRLSPAQRKLLAQFSDGRDHAYINRNVADALVRRRYLVRWSLQVVRSELASGDKVTVNDYPGGHWRHEWSATGMGYELAQHLRARQMTPYGLTASPAAPISPG